MSTDEQGWYADREGVIPNNVKPNPEVESLARVLWNPGKSSIQAITDWLAEHDAEVRREALRDAADAMAEELRSHDPWAPSWTPYGWLRDRAEQIGADS